MKRIIPLLLTLLFPAAACATLSGRLDLNYTDVAVFAAKSFDFTQSIYGVQKPLWTLYNDGKPEFNVAGWVATHTDSSDVLGGLQFMSTGADASWFTSKMTSSATIQKYASYLKCGIDIGYDPANIRGFKPQFAGFQISLSGGQ